MIPNRAWHQVTRTVKEGDLHAAVELAKGLAAWLRNHSFPPHITGHNGTTMVISHDQHPEILAVNQLDDRFSASAAIIDRELFLRGDRNLYRIARQ